jgi:DNA-binding transcriptional LysR family regulator
MDIELRHLRAFVAVVDAGSFTDAAADLRVTQATVSRTVADLERVLGAVVLRRSSRELALTPAGARLLEPARRVLAEVATLPRLAAGGEGSLRLGHAWAALGPRTTDLLARWAEEHPGVRLTLVRSVTPTAGLDEGLVDVAVVRRPLDRADLADALVGTEARVVAVAVDDPLARRRSASLNDLAGRTVALDDRTGTTTPALFPPHAAPQATRSTHGVEDWLELIASGEAIGVTTEATGVLHPHPGVVHVPLLDAPPVGVRLAWSAARPPAHVEALVQLAAGVLSGG